MVTTVTTAIAQEEFFSRFKRIKTEFKGRNVPREVAHTKQLVHYKCQT